VIGGAVSHAAMSSLVMPRHFATSSASCLEGRRSPVSSFSIVASEQEAHLATSSRVRSSLLRRSLIHWLKVVLSCMGLLGYG
jgi:hypothetical protein